MEFSTKYQIFAFWLRLNLLLMTYVFLALSNSVKEIVRDFEKVAKEVMEWGRLNVVIYDTLMTWPCDPVT